MRNLIGHLTKQNSILMVVLMPLLLAGCSDGGGGSTSISPVTQAPLAINGGGVKGPLANAAVSVYAFDGAADAFKGAAVTTASTDAGAAITGLSLPSPQTPPYIMEFSSEPETTDITTGQFPVITTMRTVVTQAMLDSGDSIYATPLTSMAVDIAVANAVDSNGTAGIQSDEFETALTKAAAQVTSTLGFGMSGSNNIFATSPVINSATVSAEAQADVAAYRTAVEALTAIAYQIKEQSAGADTDTVLSDLAADLADGVIDGSAGSTLNENTLQVLQQDPAGLPIPNTSQTVADVQSILAAETATTGSTTSTTELTDGTIVTVTDVAKTNPDNDGDGVLNADDAFPLDPNESVDSDGDGIGDNIDPDANGNGILDEDEGATAAPTATDTDGDGIEDGLDNCPAVLNASQTDTDNDGTGNACDADMDGDSVPNADDAFPLDPAESLDTDGNGIGNNADADDDGDGVLDTNDTGTSPIDNTTSCSLLKDCDGDGVLDGVDFDRVDPLVTFNYAPVAYDDVITTAEDTPITFDVTANDTDDGNAISLDSLGANNLGMGSAIISGNSIIYTPAADAHGVDSFTYTIIDDGLFSATGTVTVTIAPVNDAPVITQSSPIAVVLDEDGSPTAFAAPVIDASDIENDTLTWSLNSVPTNGVATVSGTGATPTITYQPTANFSGADSFVASVSDGKTGSASIVIDVTVNAVNDAPVVTAGQSFDVNEAAVNGAAIGTVSANDLEGSVIGYSITAGNTSGAFAIDAAGALTVADTIAIDYETATNFSLSITATDDGATISDPVDVTVNVTDANDTAPVVDAGQSFNVNETAINGDVVGTVSASDVDTVGSITGFTITGSVFAISANGQISVVDSATLAAAGTSYTEQVTATDDSVNTSVAVDVAINVVNNTPPVIDQTGPLSVIMSEDSSPTAFVAPTISATDAEGDALSWSATAATSGVAAVSGIGAGPTTFTYVPDADFNGSDSFVVNVTDGTSTVGITVNVTVEAVNDAPVAVDDVNETTLEDTAFTTINVLNNDTDIDDPNALSIASADTVSAQGGAVADNGGGTFAYTPAQDFNGFDNFSYTVTDGTDTATAVVSIEVTPVNDAPVANADTAMTTVDTPVLIDDALSNDTDVDGDALHVGTVDSTSINGGMIVNNNDGTFTYTPAAGFIGEDSFIYTVSDTSTGTAPGTVTITVNPAGTPIDMVILMGSEGGVAGIEDQQEPNVYSYWSDQWDSATKLLSVQDKQYDFVTGLFESLPGQDELVLSNGQWGPEGNIYAFDDGIGGFNVEIRDPVDDSLVIAQVKLTARYVDLSGEPMSGYLNLSWQDAMNDPNAVFATGAKLITEYKFEQMSEAYYLWTDNWCENDGTARFVTLNGNCNGVEVDSGIYAQTLDELIAAAAWIDPDDDSTPPADIPQAWEGDKTLTLELVGDGTANYYIIDWTNADVVSLAATGTWTIGLVQGVDMVQFQIPAELSTQFPNDLDEGLNYFLAFHDGFVRQGQKDVVGDVGYDNGPFNGIAMDNVVANFNVPLPTFACDYETPWGAGEPASFNSFTDFQAVLTACGGAVPTTSSDMVGTWSESWTDGSGDWVATWVFEDSAMTATFTETLNSVVTDTGTVGWSVANDLVTLTDDSSFVDVWARTASGIKVYTEESSWSVSPNITTLDATAEGEIWTNSISKMVP